MTTVVPLPADRSQQENKRFAETRREKWISSPGKENGEPLVFVKSTLVPVHGPELRTFHLDSQALRQGARFLDGCLDRNRCL